MSIATTSTALQGGEERRSSRLQESLLDYLKTTKLHEAPKDAAIFPSAVGKTGHLTSRRAIHVNDICRMMKRRLRGARLPDNLSPHWSREEDVQRLAGHADPRTTRLYYRRDKKITRSVVERISI